LRLVSHDVIEDEETDIEGQLSQDPVFQEAARGCLNGLSETHEPPLVPQGIENGHIFHQREIRIASHFAESAASHKEAGIAKEEEMGREAEEQRNQMQKSMGRIVLWRESPGDDGWIAEGIQYGDAITSGGQAVGVAEEQALTFGVLRSQV
jgi:hypothetical protein